MVLKGLYSILLGIFLALFVAIGISTFYPEFTYRAPQSCMVPAEKPGETSPIAVAKQQEKCQRDQEALQQQQLFYNQVVSSIALVAAVIYFVVSFTVLRNNQVFSYGFLFGSIFTLLYSVARGLNTNQAIFRFILIVVSLILVMTIGYLRFAQPDKAQR